MNTTVGVFLVCIVASKALTVLKYRTGDPSRFVAGVFMCRLFTCVKHGS
jgi:hypothetical protein